MLKKSSPLKHKEAGHMLLTDEAHQKEHGNDVDVLEEPKKKKLKLKKLKKKNLKKKNLNMVMMILNTSHKKNLRFGILKQG